MKDFSRGVVCAIAVMLFGKIAYEAGRRRDRRTADGLKELIDAIKNVNEEKTES